MLRRTFFGRITGALGGFAAFCGLPLARGEAKEATAVITGEKNWRLKTILEENKSGEITIDIIPPDLEEYYEYIPAGMTCEGKMICSRQVSRTAMKKLLYLLKQYETKVNKIHVD